jgi:hypothetical protein
MKTAFITLTLSASLFAFGCSQSSEPTTERSSTQAVVSIEGVNSGDLSSALLAISEVEISADGTALSTSIDEARANLAHAGEKLAVHVAVPSQAQMLDVRIKFDDYGGYDANNGRAGAIDARGTEIRFRVPASELHEGGGAAVQLDLARSVVGRGVKGAALLPHYVVRY